MRDALPVGGARCPRACDSTGIAWRMRRCRGVSGSASPSLDSSRRSRRLHCRSCPIPPSVVVALREVPDELRRHGDDSARLRVLFEFHERAADMAFLLHLVASEDGLVLSGAGADYPNVADVAGPELVVMAVE